MHWLAQGAQQVCKSVFMEASKIQEILIDYITSQAPAQAGIKGTHRDFPAQKAPSSPFLPVETVL